MTPEEWLFKFPYRKESEDMFYHRVVHVEQGNYITTDGSWMRIHKNVDPDMDGDYKLLKNGTFRRIKADEIWRFPTSWKQILKIEMSEGVHLNNRQDLVQWLYGSNFYVPIEQLILLEDTTYQMANSRNGILVFRSAFGLTVLPIP